MVAMGIDGRGALWIGELTAKIFLRESETFCADARIVEKLLQEQF
jgi:hypothetical protein